MDEITNPGVTNAAPSQPEDSAELARALRAQLASVTGGIAPDVYVNAWWDWYLNLTKEPPKQLQVVQDAVAKSFDTWNFFLRAASGEPLAPAEGDSRFVDEAWSRWPFNIVARGYRNYADWLQQTYSQVPGVAAEHERSLNFAASNALEALSPSNFLATNPELLNTTRAEAGQNLVRGFKNWLEDVERTLGNKGPAGAGKFVVGRDIAATPGKVVMRNALAELIQYGPTTDSVFAEPILIIPAWIMKYYILDLSAKNSMVRYLVSQGHTVFIVSWKNPDASDRELGMDDYLRLGVRDMVNAVAQIVPGQKIHTVGYCIGGTLLSIAAAAYAGDGDQRLASMTLLAAQQDFSEPGELSVFISPSQLDMLEAVMERTGVLSSDQMAAAFTLLRSRDLLWTPAVNTYVRGKRESPNDLMAWNADGTRMPGCMHAQYLRQLYLNNELARGEFRSEGRPVELSKIQLPMFVVGTETDHVAPWQSVYKARGLTRSADFTFLLTSGGHNAGIVSGPVHPRRRHRVRTWLNDVEVLAPQTWLETTPPEPGSWWPVWEHWLAQHSSAVRVNPPQFGAAAAGYLPIADAPGEYVLQK
ncbi:MAG TPA: alpha/beta fold hydrolase [Steroidobacteraceae bacterium]|nr:alpha/beta fold hydrolase [Steroidobacteraceae bacterium]